MWEAPTTSSDCSDDRAFMFTLTHPNSYCHLMWQLGFKLSSNKVIPTICHIFLHGELSVGDLYQPSYTKWL